MRFQFKLWLIEARETFWRGLARLLPRPLVYWATMRLVVYATGPRFGNSHPDYTSVMIALQRWQT
jgi:hypothetical protein